MTAIMVSSTILHKGDRINYYLHKQQLVHSQRVRNYINNENGQIGSFHITGSSMINKIIRATISQHQKK